MYRLLTCLMACALLCLPASAATGMTTVIASKIVDASGNPLASGTVSFRVVDATTKPLSVRVGGGGQTISTPATGTVTNGAFSVPVVDVSMTTPSMPCIAVTVIDNATGDPVYQNPCIQPTGPVYSLDNFTTNTTPILPQAGSTVHGDLAVNGSFSTTGTFQPGAVYTGLVDSNVIQGNVNGVLNANRFTGTDIGQQVNNAIASMANNTGTIQIPDGNYYFSTTIRLTHSGQHLVCGAGVTLHYTGSSDAIAFISPTAEGAAAWTVEGQDGCLLDGSQSTGNANGIRIFPTNSTGVRNMRIKNFVRGAGIRLDGPNSVQIHDNVVSGSLYGVYTISAPFQTTSGPYLYSGPCCGFAPNAVHIHDNEFNSDGWGYYSANGGVTATRDLGNVLRDNVFEGNTQGDIRLGWDAHTIIDGNYFESSGVGVSAGVGADNVYDIHVKNNYFTASDSERSEIEIGYGFDFFIEGNYEEGGAAVHSKCSVNVVPGPYGGASNIVLTNAFNQHSEAGVGTQPTPNEFCINAQPASPSGTYRFLSNVSISNGLSSLGRPNLNTSLTAYPSTNTIIAVLGPLTIWAGPAAPGGTCPTNLATVWYWPGGWSLCVNGYWTAK